MEKNTNNTKLKYKAPCESSIIQQWRKVKLLRNGKCFFATVYDYY